MIDLKFDHNKTDQINNNLSRDIGNRLLALHLIELTIKLGGKLAILATIVWATNTLLQRIDNTANKQQTTLTTDTCGKPNRIQLHTTP